MNVTPFRPKFSDLLAIWDGLAIKFLCPNDPVAHSLINYLWKDQTKKPSYSDFREAFVYSCSKSKKLPLKNEILLEELCRENLTNPTVSFEQFCHIVGWYGPLNAQTDCSEFFTRFRDIKNQWFFRSFESDQDSDRLLKVFLEENCISTTETCTRVTPKAAMGNGNEENDHKRGFILKYHLNEIGKFELRYYDQEGQIKSLLIQNKEGVLHFPDTLNHSNLPTLLNILLPSISK